MPAFTVICPSCSTANRIPADKEGKAGRCGNCHRALPPMYYQPQQLTERSFDAFIKEYHGPVLVEFWAPWCPHCRSYAPAVRKAAGLLAGSAAVVQIDSQDNPQLAARFGVRGIPVLFLFKDGRIAAQLEGARSSEAIMAWFRQQR